jgi:hypothetical protein
MAGKAGFAGIGGGGGGGGGATSLDLALEGTGGTGGGGGGNGGNGILFTAGGGGGAGLFLDCEKAANDNRTPTITRFTLNCFIIIFFIMIQLIIYSIKKPCW